MSSFHVDCHLDILFEKLAAQIGAQPCLVSELRLEAPDDLQGDIVKMQGWTLISRGCPLDNGIKLIDSQLAFKNVNK